MQKIIKRERFTTAELDKIKNLEKEVADLEKEETIIASKTRLGNVKIGDGLSITNKGVLSCSVASGGHPGLVLPTTGFTLAADGTVTIDTEWLTTFVNNIINPSNP